MCNYNGLDIGKPIKKYDVYYVDLGVSEEDTKGDIMKDRPCVIVSLNEFNTVSRRHTIVPIRTIHTDVIDTIDKAEKVVNEHRSIYGIVLVPIKTDDNLYRFADVSQIRSVDIQRISNYHTTIVNPEVRRRLDVEIENLIVQKSTYEKKENNFQNKLDVSAIVKKFDIWQVFNGAKNSKYVVVSANSSSSTVMTAPFYNESPKPITDENLSEYLKNMEKEGVSCVPFKYSTTNEYSFINLSKMKYLNVTQLRKLECSIVSEKVRKDIDLKIWNLYYKGDEGIPSIPVIINKDESVEDKDKQPEVKVEAEVKEPVVVKEPETKPDKHPPVRVFKPRPANEKEFPDDWNLIYCEYNSGKWKAKEAAELLDLKEWKFHELVKKHRNNLKAQGIDVETKQVGRGGKKVDIKPFPPGFEMYYKMLKAGTITKSEVCNKLSIKRVELNDLIEQCDHKRYITKA